MNILLKILLFIIKLPFRMIALCLAFVLGVISVMIQMIMGMGMTVFSLFNLVLLVAFFGILYTKDYYVLWNLGILLALEGVMVTIGSFIAAVLIIIKDNLMSFVIGQSYISAV